MLLTSYARREKSEAVPNNSWDGDEQGKKVVGFDWVWYENYWCYHTRSFPSQIVCVCDEGGRVKWRFETWVVDPNYLEERPNRCTPEMDSRLRECWEASTHSLDSSSCEGKVRNFFFKLISFTYIPSYLLIILIYELMNHYTIHNNI